MKSNTISLEPAWEERPAQGRSTGQYPILVLKGQTSSRRGAPAGPARTEGSLAGGSGPLVGSPRFTASLAVPATGKNREYLSLLRQAELASWEASMPLRQAATAKPKGAVGAHAPLPRAAGESYSENWFFRLLALVAAGTAAWACWDSVSFFNQWQGFVQFVQGLVP